MTTLTSFDVYDLRFPQFANWDSPAADAMNLDVRPSIAYLRINTDTPGLSGAGFTYTLGRGTELCCGGIKALERLVAGRSLESIVDNMGQFWRDLTSDNQLRWIGPEKGVIHMATGAIVNAVWDLWGKAANKPIWRLISEMSPEEVVRLIDFRYITDCITPEEALLLLKERRAGYADRLSTLERTGYPCYSTSAGWLNYSDEKLVALSKASMKAGFTKLKYKVGRDLDEDIRRVGLAREAVGPDADLMIDANQVWDVDQAIAWLKHLEFTRPRFIEEPTSPDDIQGHRQIREALLGKMQVATGEMCQNRVMAKQFIMQHAIDILQIDATRLGGLNEVLAILLMAAKHNVKVMPHAGGIGLSEHVQHIAMIDYLVASADMTDRAVEYVDENHDYFIHPCQVVDGHYVPPKDSGYSGELKAGVIEKFSAPQ